MLEDLDRALDEQKMKRAEKDPIEVIARALDLSPAAVSRVVCAYQACTGHTPRFDVTALDTYVPNEVQQAITHAIEMGLRRLAVRSAIEGSKTISIMMLHLIPDDNPGKVCEGCPRSLTCIATNEYHPPTCIKYLTAVFPLRFTDAAHVEVECSQPVGKYIVPLTAFPPITRGDL